MILAYRRGKLGTVNLVWLDTTEDRAAALGYVRVSRRGQEPPRFIDEELIGTPFEQSYPRDETPGA